MASSWLARRKFQSLLFALLLLLVAYPVLRGPLGSPVLARVLHTAMILAGGWVLFSNWRVRFVAILVGVPAVMGAWVGYVVPDLQGADGAIFFHLMAAVFQLLVLVVLLQKVYREPNVTVDVVAAALCGYLLLGVAFGHAYCLLDVVNPASFRGLETGRIGPGIHLSLTYFSFVTLTTLGYGDITPVTDTARALALVEAVTGQFYLAVLVADLVGKRVAQAISPQLPLKP